jgi:hypothetical protein
MTHTRRAPAIAWLLISALVLSMPSPALAYLKFGVRSGGRLIDVRWNQSPIRYFVNERDIPGVTGAQFREAVRRAFATWQAVPTATIRTEFQGATSASPNDADGRTTLGYLDRPDLDRVLAATSFVLNSQTGEILESDVFFNTRFAWSTAAGGETGRVDVESIAVHEIGHLLGLGHSAIGETEVIPGGRRVLGAGAVMFPIAFSPGNLTARSLLPDDIAGVVDLYGTTEATEDTGSITGTVTKDGRGVFGAHIVAFHPETGAMVGGFSLNASGEFVIAGLAPGPYILRVEPLDDAATDSFFTGAIDVDFRVTYAPRMVVAPRNGTANAIQIAVRPK